MDEESHRFDLYGPHLAHFLGSRLGQLVFSTEAVFLRANRTLDTLFITVRGPQNASKVSRKSFSWSLSSLAILTIYLMRYTLLLFAPIGSFLTLVLDDFVYPIEDCRNWIYLMFIVVTMYAIVSRFILLYLSFRGNLNIFTDWGRASLAVHLDAPYKVNSRLLKLERCMMAIFEVSRLTSWLITLLLFGTVSIMFYSKLCDQIKKGSQVFFALCWYSLWPGVIFIGVSGVIFPLFMSTCGVIYASFRADCCIDLLKTTGLSHKKLLSAFISRSLLLSKLSTGVNQLYTTIDRQKLAFGSIFLAFVTMASSSSAIMTLLFVYGRSNVAFNSIILLFSLVAWLIIAVIPLPLFVLNGKVKLLYKQLMSLQVRCLFLTAKQKCILLKLIESVGDKRHPFAYTISGRPYTSKFHVKFLLSAITLIFLLVDIYESTR